MLAGVLVLATSRVWIHCFASVAGYLGYHKWCFQNTIFCRLFQEKCLFTTCFFPPSWLTILRNPVRDGTISERHGPPGAYLRGQSALPCTARYPLREDPVSTYDFNMFHLQEKKKRALKYVDTWDLGGWVVQLIANIWQSFRQKDTWNGCFMAQDPTPLHV